MNARILIVDDEPLIRKSLQGALLREGYVVDTAGSGAEAIAKFAEDRPDAIVLDLVLGDRHGLDLLTQVRTDAPEVKVVVITAHGSVETAVAAMKAGAYDFIRKPFDLEEVLATVKNALHTSTLEHRVEYLAGRDRRRVEAREVSATAPAMQALMRQATIVAQNQVPIVLLLGETGTGKQLLARFLHDHSSAARGPYIDLNCSTIPDTLIESELFGHERGAFSDARSRKLGLVELADGGTLFLDEIGDLALTAQAKLLTFLEQRTFRRLGGTAQRHVDVRVVAATNRDLAALVRAGSFREDLWYRLCGLVLQLPPLRERREDIQPLVATFLQEANRQYARRWQNVAPDALTLLEKYRWPGNVRELRAVIHRAALMNDDQILQPIHLPAELIGAALAEVEVDPGPVKEPTSMGIPTLAEVEAIHIRRVLALCGGNKTLAAQRLGITRQTLAKKVEESRGAPGHERTE